MLHAVRLGASALGPTQNCCPTCEILLVVDSAHAVVCVCVCVRVYACMYSVVAAILRFDDWCLV